MGTSFFEEFKDSTDNPSFYSKAYAFAAKNFKKNHLDEDLPIKRAISEQFESLSSRLDKSKLQESTSVRTTIRARTIASLLISDAGELNLEAVAKSIEELEAHLPSLGPERQYDTPRLEHLLNALKNLKADKSLQQELKMISRPYANKMADQIIRETLLLSAQTTITDAHTKQAALSAWFCYLRQNVGSCFATAPAIVIQNEEPHSFFKDIRELLETGRMKRTFGGNEYIAPLTSSSGIGNFKRHILINTDNPVEIIDLSLSPGLLLSLESAALISPKLPLKQKIQELLQRIKTALLPQKGAQAINAEELLRKILMNELKITEKDLLDFENRPRGLLQTSLVMSLPQASTKIRGRAEACSAFLTKMELAKKAFNSLTENPLLKMWEFSLASFAETKPGFTRWNMYASLGFNADQKGGIGFCLHHEIKQRLDQSNQKVQDIQGEYETLYGQLKFLEGRMRSASSEKEAQWIRVEYESRRNEFRTLEAIRDKEHFRAKRFANLLNDLLITYDDLFPRYFQEVYDPDMHEVNLGPYDDSPAGFRLLYKHGRENTSAWTLIYTPQEFIEALSSFFVATEPEVVHDPVFEGLQDDISALITTIVSHVKTDEFLITSLWRMSEAHNAPLIKNPLEHLDRIEKKPWAYTSGGTMHNLMLCYFRLDEKPKEVERWVENPLELLVFFIDSIKQMPPSLFDKYLGSKNLSLLMHSPTHAFTLRPGQSQFKSLIETEGFTYTAVRDNYVIPAENFVSYLFLDQEMMTFLIDKLKNLVPKPFQNRFQSITSDCFGRKNPPEFRHFITHAIDMDNTFRLSEFPILTEDQIDSALFNWLPLTSRYELKNRAEKLMEKLPGLNNETHLALSSILDEIIQRWADTPFLTADHLQNICKAALCLTLGKTSTRYDYPRLINQYAQKLGYAMPAPVIFADTNWVKDWLAFLVNPGTGSLDLWRVDPLGRIGAPMSEWRQWINGSNRSRTWGIFNKPQEYQA